jgi:hypothetical protein
MMPLDDVLTDSPAGRAIVEVARRQGGDPEQVRLAVAAVLPELTRHLERNTLSRGGLADFVGALGAPQHGARLANADLAGDPAVSEDGNAILQHIVGGKDASRAIAAEASRASGLSESLIKMLLPFIASMLMSALQRYLQGGLGDILKRLPQGPGQSQTDDEGEDGDRPAPGRRGRSDDSDEPRGGYGRGFELPQQGPIEGIPNRGGRAPMDAPRAPQEAPRADRPWPSPSEPSPPSSPGSIPQQVPPSWPGDSPGRSGRSPFDDISDILRRGAGPKVDGQPLQRSVRDLLGGILGFSSRGVIGWIIRLIFVRFGWGILKRLIGRSLGGR